MTSNPNLYSNGDPASVTPGSIRLYMVFADKDENRFVVPCAFVGEGQLFPTELLSQVCAEICLTLGVRPEGDPLEIQAGPDGHYQLFHQQVQAKTGDGKVEIWLISGPQFDQGEAQAKERGPLQ